MPGLNGQQVFEQVQAVDPQARTRLDALFDKANWKDPFCLGTLAAAYAEAGKFSEAVKWQSRALDFSDIYGKSATEQARQRLLLYEAHKPYHEAD